MPPSSKAGVKPAKAASAAVKAKTAPAPKAVKSASVAKPAATRKTTAKPATKTTPKAAAAPRKTSAKGRAASITPEQRRCYVEVAAYYIAERRGFDGGAAMDDWVMAEAEIDRLVREGLIGP